jgi:hypothetical protein
MHKCRPHDIRNPGFSIANKAKGQAVELSLQFCENNIIIMHMLFTYKYDNIFVYLIFTNQNKTN